MLTQSPVSDEKRFFARLRRREFARVTHSGVAYLDYTGSALHAERQLSAHGRTLRSGVFGNPHSENEPSRSSTSVVERARAAVLRFFDADAATYTVVFTANASAAIKLVAEGFAFGPDAPLVLTADNHNSVNGIREFAIRASGEVRYLPLDSELRVVEPAFDLRSPASGLTQGLFAYPAQSNFSGVQHSLALLESARAAGFTTLLDAASFAASNALSLRSLRPDFVALSFYKMFGYPTGVGALIARRDALARLRRPWFAGGTVRFASVQNAMHRLSAGAEGFEDGTPNFLALSGLEPGFEFLSSIGMERLHDHVMRLTARLLRGLRGLQHANGSPTVRIYGPQSTIARGGTVAFNVLDARGRVVPYWVIEERCRDAGVAVRGGCFCNPGAAEAAFGMDAMRARSCLTRAGDDFTVPAFAECLGGDAVGAVRASFGAASSGRDVRRLIDVLAVEAGR